MAVYFFTTGNPLNIHVAFSRSFSVRRVVNFPKFQFILSPGPLGHPPITPLCSSNWAGQDAPLALWTPLASTSSLIGTPCCLLSLFFRWMRNLCVGGTLDTGTLREMRPRESALVSPLSSRYGAGGEPSGSGYQGLCWGLGGLLSWWVGGRSCALPKNCRSRGNSRVQPRVCVCLSTVLIPHCCSDMV